MSCPTWARLPVTALLFVLWYLPGEPARASCAQTEGARDIACEIVQAFGSDAVAILRSGATLAEKEQKLLALYHARFDVHGIGTPLARCVGVNWNGGLTNGEQERAAELIGRYIVKNLVLKRFGDFLKGAKSVAFEVRRSDFVGATANVEAALRKDAEFLGVRFFLRRQEGPHGAVDYRIREMCIEAIGACMLRTYTQAMCRHAGSSNFRALVGKLASAPRAFIETLQRLVEGTISLAERPQSR